MNQAMEVLQKYFGYSSFRKGQTEIVGSILAGRDTFGIMPTGGGKSICYQVPAMLLEGLTLVISPLISLMKDQVDALDKAGIPATYINSSLAYEEARHRLQDAAEGIYKIIYIAPERLEAEGFVYVLQQMPIALVTIDEAHCVSQWGHDFRPSYRNIAAFIQKLSRRPIIAAFTATATQEVKEDVVRLLELQAPGVFVTGFDRPNLYFAVERGAQKDSFVQQYIASRPAQAGIIYTSTRKEADRLTDKLRAAGIRAGKYHAGMGDIERNASQEDFLYDRTQVMVATNAFGMGIDKSNVRYVVHFNLPRSMESYYQEAGRAGRDGDPAECVLLYGAADVQTQKYLIEETLLSPDRKDREYQRLQQMVDYCHTPGCLRRFILQYFGEESTEEGCGNCSTCSDTVQWTDMTIEAQKVLSCIKRMGENYGVQMVTAVLKGSKLKKLKELRFDTLTTYGILQEMTADQIAYMIRLLAAEEYLQFAGTQYPVLKLGAKAVAVLRGEQKVMLRYAKPKEMQLEEDAALFDRLRGVRREIAQEENVPPYVIFHDSTLREMACRLPGRTEDLLQIPGIGERKKEHYGDRFITVIVQYAIEHGLQLQQPAVTASAAVRDEKVPSHHLTYQMYGEGNTLEEIAAARELGIITIQDHLLRCYTEGMPVNLHTFVTPEQQKLVEEAAAQAGTDRLRPIKDLLPSEIDYFAIKAALALAAGREDDEYSRR